MSQLLRYRYWILLALVVLVSSSILAYQSAENKAISDRQTEQFCEAIPNVAAAGAQALVNIVVNRDREEGTPEAEIRETIAIGEIYVAEARRLALADLPDCPQP